MPWSGTSVLVTGAGGFIGSHLVERLVELGATTRAFVRYNSKGSAGWLAESPARDAVEVVFGDVCDRDTVREALRGIDTVFHLAALIAIPYSYRAPQSYVRTNVEGTANVLQEARDANVRVLVHTSTSEVYGSARYAPIDEAHPLQAQSPYAASKIGADKLAEAFHRSYGLPVVTVRPFNTFGPRQSARAVIPAIVVQALAGDTIRLGNLRPTRDFNFVADIVDGFVRAAQTPAAIGETVHLGTGREIAIGDLAQLVFELLGKRGRIVTDPERARATGSEVERLCADARKATALLGWQPRHDLRGGLSATIEWVRAHAERYRANVYAT